MPYRTRGHHADRPERYKLTANVGDKHNDKEVILISRNNNDTIQSATVANGTVVFEDTISTPILVQIRVNGGPSLGAAVLESGEITFSPETGATGTNLNSIMAELNENSASLNAKLMAIDNNDPNAGTLRNDLFSAYQKYSDSLMNANIDNPVGASLFMGKAYDMSISEIEKTLIRPSFSKNLFFNSEAAHKQKSSRRDRRRQAI